MTDRIVIGRVGDIPDGGRVVVSVKDRPVVVFRKGAEYFALLDRCPHKGGSLSEGQTIGLVTATAPGAYSYGRPGEIVRCPWHAWEFDIRTGRSYCDPERYRAPSYEVVRVAGRELAEGPYRAETFEVTINEEYIVIQA